MKHPLLLAILFTLTLSPALAQDAPETLSPKTTKPQQPKPSKEDVTEQAAKFAAESIAAFRKGDIKAAEEALLKQLALQPKNFVVHYNLACCRALQDDVEGGMSYLSKAIETGFCDRRQLERDPSLNNLRSTDRFKQILENWEAVLEARRDAQLKSIEETFKKGYTNSRDDHLRLTYRSSFDENTLTAAKAELSKIADWGDANLFSDLFDPARAANDAWVLVILPNRLDFMKWIVSIYGPGAVNSTNMIAGEYQHDAKRLVSMDMGATLRHEFFHVLHWRDMTRRGQFHPIWVMEGLCSLVEDYDTDDEGNLHPATSWRTNTIKRLEKLGRLDPIETLAKLPPERFSGDRPLAHYAQARTIFLFLYQKQKLKEWYTFYTGKSNKDPSGVQAIEEVMGKPIKEVNKDFKAWVRALPDVPETIATGMASLGIEIDAGNGEGPVVAGIDRSSQTELKINDIITQIDHRATRDNAELVRVLSACRPGQTVEVTYRRGKNYGTANITLVAK